MTVPHITIEQAEAIWSNSIDKKESTTIFNKRIDAYNEKQATEQYITAEEARKMGAGNAEFLGKFSGNWIVCDEYCNYISDFKYRAIKQEPVGMCSSTDPAKAKLIYAEPHAELKANLVKLDGVLMSREAAIEKWESQKDVCDVYINGVLYVREDHPRFDDSSIEYQLHLKPTVKLTIDDEPAKMLTPAQCEAEQLARIDTHDVEFESSEQERVILLTPPRWTPFTTEKAEYRLIRKQPKLIPLDWKDVPVGVMTNKGELRGVYLGGDGAYRICTETRGRDDDTNWSRFHASFVELAPASEQPWIAVQNDDSQAFVKILFDLIAKGISAKGEQGRFKVTGLSKGYGYPEQKGGLK